MEIEPSDRKEDKNRDEGNGHVCRTGQASKNGHKCQKEEEEEEEDAGADINSIIPSVGREGLHYPGQGPPLTQ